jgi:hypothetical protein
MLILDGGRDNALVWLACSCAAQGVYPVNAAPPAVAPGDTRK